MVSIVIGIEANLSYISPKLMEMFHLQASKFENPLLVQLVTWEKRKVVEKVENCPIELAG